MTELLRSADLIFISFIEAALAGAGIECFVLDRSMNAVHGGIPAFPCRVMVRDEDAAQARRIVRETGHGGELR
ncbi:MAG: DUF2007 domain-containing protein [Pseudomonadota bacterium]